MVDERLIAEGDLASSVANVCVVATQGDFSRTRGAFMDYLVKTQDYEVKFPGIREAFNKGIKQGVAPAVMIAAEIGEYLD